jgi:cell fate regulator YaaT (PSP1 superfamily)
MTTLEYLVSYGGAGDFGRFHAAAPLACRRGDRVVVRSHRGLELGSVLCPATPGHAHFLPNTTVGQLLRPASAEDEAQAGHQRERAAALCEDARHLAVERGLPLEVLDAEMLLDGEQAILHHLHWADFDERELVSALSRQYDLRVRLHALKSEAAEEEEHGCGRPDCGGGSGGCSSCSSGGCSTCGAGTTDMRAYFAALREQMQRQDRVPLL